MTKNIVMIVGPCAVESEKQVWNQAYKTSLVRDIAQPYGIQFHYRAGAWKPRTEYWDKNNEQQIKVFEGVGEIGLRWLSEIADHYDMPIVSECMSEMDLRHFGRYLNPDRDYIQIGARTNQAFALLYEVGGTPFGVVLKSPQHGIDLKEAQGSLQRFLKNREKVYCIRGQKRFIHPSGQASPQHKDYMESILREPNQHPDARNLNNIETINVLRNIPYFKENDILLVYDPSHVFGGKNNEVKRKIGESVIQAIKEFDYDWVMVEVHDTSADAKSDKDQALVTTYNGIDYSKTNMGTKPLEHEQPLSLVEIVKELITDRVARGLVAVSPQQLAQDMAALDNIRWDMAA